MLELVASVILSAVCAGIIVGITIDIVEEVRRTRAERVRVAERKLAQAEESASYDPDGYEGADWGKVR